jgi:hypothetical protein
MKWTVHAAEYMTEIRNAHKIFEAKPEGKDHLRIPVYRENHTEHINTK